MDPISGEAIDALLNAIRALLPVIADPNLRPAVAIEPLRIDPLGVGGFVGYNEDPPGEIYGRRLDARVVVNTRAANVDALETAVSDTTRSLLAADRAALEQQGIYRVRLSDIGERATVPPATGTDPVLVKPVTFSVIFEYLKKPAAAEGIIQEIPINIQLQQD